tara:strand:- start:882 stop:1550 length:669 start_codon:yes stop_codon:yes gene_type:complete
MITIIVVNYGLVAMFLEVKADTKKLTKHLKRLQKKQIPFATSNALNSTAFDVRTSLQRLLPRFIDRPTKGIVKSVQVTKSTKKTLTATVGFVGFGFRTNKWSTSPAKIMDKHITGGTRKPKRKAIAVPVGLKVNKYGNIPRNKITKLLSDKDKYFSGVPKGRTNAGIYERTKNGLKMLLAWEDRAHYKGGRFPFNRIVNNTVNKRYKKRFETALNNALRTAR